MPLPFIVTFIVSFVTLFVVHFSLSRCDMSTWIFIRIYGYGLWIWMDGSR